MTSKNPNPKKIKEGVYEVKVTGDMKVPLHIYASKKIMTQLKKDRAIQQGMNVACLPGVCNASFMMADAHQGYGFPIGGVAAIDYENGCISPGGIGFDINCGVRLLVTPLKKSDLDGKVSALIDAIYDHVPVGVGGESDIRLTDEDIEDVLKNGAKWAVKHGYGTKEDLEFSEEGGAMPGANPDFITPRAKARGRKQLGTLGAGNHFLEIQYAEELLDPKTAKAFGIAKDQVCFMIHCGSRGLGHQVCSDYIRKMEEEDPELMASLPEKDLVYAKSGTSLFNEYLGAMASAANYAWANRHIIAHQVRLAFQEVMGTKPEDIKLVYDVAHNIAKIEEHLVNGKKKKLIVHRKGATRAFPKGRKELPKKYQSIGQPVLIPGSMGTASYVLVGTEEGFSKTFGSTAHGAGRLMSRHQANDTFTPEGVRDDLAKQNIVLKSRSQRGITEEAPGVYKDVSEVVKVSDMTGIGKLVVKLKPLGVVKG